MPLGSPKAVIMKIIPFSSVMEFQRASQKAVRSTGYAESAVWAVFAASSVISILLSLSQLTPASVQSDAPNDCSVVSEQQNIKPIHPIQTT
jgi:hypothetical protein